MTTTGAPAPGIPEHTNLHPVEPALARAQAATACAKAAQVRHASRAARRDWAATDAEADRLAARIAALGRTTT